MLLDLTCAGRVSRAEARSTGPPDGVLPPAAPGARSRSTWLRRGMLTTWRCSDRAVDMVDLTVVVNALALLHALDLARIP
jgi:hypothetical protein